jgi:hypothetical protein
MRDDDTFTARTPDGRTVRLRVKRDIEKLNDLDPGERLRAMLKMFPNPSTRKQLDDRETSEITGASYPRGRLFLDVLADLDEDADDRDDEDADDRDDDEAVTKAHEHRGHHDLTASLVRHLHEALGRRREAHGYQKSAKESRMKDSLTAIMKDCGGPVALAKTICNTGRSYGASEQEYVEAASRYASELYGLPGDRAFAKLCESEGSVVRACAVLKAAEFSVFEPRVFGREAVNPDNPGAMLEAYQEILRTIRERWPYRSGAQQLAAADEELARRFHVRPQANYANAYAPPSSPERATKFDRDPVPNADTAYAALMHKAEQLRSERPELSIAQAFERTYTAPANRELAKRERIESAPR